MFYRGCLLGRLLYCIVCKCTESGNIHVFFVQIFLSVCYCIDTLFHTKAEWQVAEVLFGNGTELAVFEFVRGGKTYEDDEGDIALDDVVFEATTCGV